MKNNDKIAILNVHKLAFGETEGEEVAQLADSLLEHPETLSINVRRDGKLAGNVLFTPFFFTEHPQIRCQLLAPCGVLPEYQGQGVGRELMETSLEHLKSNGTDAVFVLGVPTFYPRYGFAPTDKPTPYPDLLTIPESWMAFEYAAGTIDKLRGETRAIPQLMHAHFWDTSMYE